MDILGNTHLIVVRFDFRRVSLAALDSVGINGALRKEARAVALADSVPEYVIKLRTDDIALFLRIGDAPELAEEFLLTVDADKVHVKKLGKGLFNKIALVLAHQSLVNKDAGELLADRPADQSGGNRRINTARKSEHDALIPHLFTNPSNSSIDKAVHLPVALAAADVIEEVAQHDLSVLRVVYLGMELNAVQPSLFIRHRGNGTMRGSGDHTKAFGNLIDIIAVTHP